MTLTAQATRRNITLELLAPTLVSIMDPESHAESPCKDQLEDQAEDTGSAPQDPLPESGNEGNWELDPNDDSPDLSNVLNPQKSKHMYEKKHETLGGDPGGCGSAGSTHEQSNKNSR